MHSDRPLMRRGVPAALTAAMQAAMLATVVACGTNDAGPLGTDQSAVGIAALTARNDSTRSATSSVALAARGMVRDPSATTRQAVTDPAFAAWPFPQRLALNTLQKEQIRLLRHVYDEVVQSETAQLRSLAEQAVAATAAGRPATEIEELLARIAVVSQRLFQTSQRFATSVMAVLTPDQQQWIQQYQSCLTAVALSDEKMEEVTAIKSHFEGIYGDDLAATENALREIAAVSDDRSLTDQQRQERIAEILESVRPARDRLERGLIELERDLAAIVPPPTTCWED